MKKNRIIRFNNVTALILFLLISCTDSTRTKDHNDQETVGETYYFEGTYTPFTLNADLSGLSENEKAMLPLLIEAAEIMDELFWIESYGDKEELLQLLPDEKIREFAVANYGPWDRLNDNKSFVEGIEDKPRSANFYPHDMTIEEFEKVDLEGKADLYTMIRRDDSGNLLTIPYHVFFKEQVQKASQLLARASELADDPGLKNYLKLRSDAFLTDDYQASDMAWLDMQDNTIDVVIGPIETYEDKLFGYKAAHEAFILIKDKDWSQKLEKYAEFLPELQQNLPVPPAYKKESPGSDAQLNAYDVVYYAGDCNAGSKTIAINLPNDEEVQLTKGTRRLQLKNAMQAKFDKILVPIADELITEEQVEHINFDAFFSCTMFHEVAHGLGIKNTLDGTNTVRKALQEHASAIEEGKADILGLYMIHELHKKGELERSMEDYYVTFMAGIFRSVRFGAASAHGKANMIRFNYFKEMNAFIYNPETGKYKVDFENIEKAMNSLSEKILVLQGDGNYDAVNEFVNAYANIPSDLRKDLDILSEKKIPVDIQFIQGVEVLDL
jgi:hypothetical protein